MAIDIHALELVPATQSAMADRIVLGLQSTVATIAGSGAGAAVVTAVSFAAGSLPNTYCVVVTPAVDATVFVSAKTNSGFNVTLTPRLANATLPASSFDVVVLA